VVLVAQVVHTTGVNWDSILAIGVEIIIIVGALFGVLTRVLKLELKDTVEKQVAPLFGEIKRQLQEIRNDVDSHSTAIARLEGFQDGRQTYQKQLDQSRRQANDIINDPE
jgi:hypothetical protein